ncbi:MAG: aspartate--tRNA ligase [Bacteroidetes bacterium QS_9_68_14]|nr:MAG: aspartate--tRNA ligase [Bacteroidetes bacterium QS_9_68_14]
MPETPQRPADRSHLVTPGRDPHSARSGTCGDLRMEDTGDVVVLKGWVDTRRSFGGMVFLDLRDRGGLTQIVCSEETLGVEAYETAQELRREDVISVRGEVTERHDPNYELATGRVEVQAAELAVLSVAETPPFVTSAHEERAGSGDTTEATRLRHRYLDLRRPELQENLALRHRFYRVTREHFDRHDFLEIETPVLMKSTPEGARDFLVPSRLHAGEFYALPQSPQTYKQLLMVGGLDRYVQIVKCFRDEDLRADRQPEFTQVDVEMAFATEEQVFELIEGHMAALWREIKGEEIETPFERLPHEEAVRRYGTDKPDTRFGMEIQDVSRAFEESGFRIFDSIIEAGGHVVALVAEGEANRSRSAMDRLDEHVRNEIGAGGLIYFKKTEGGEVESSVSFDALPQEHVERAAQEEAGAEPGDLVLVLAGHAPEVFEQAGALRLHVAEQMDLREGEDQFLWVTDFPLLEWSEEEGRYAAMHHPFTAPHPDDLGKLDSAPGDVRSRGYDLVLNGHEIGGGSIRIHDRATQERVFEALGIGEEEAQRRFGFLLEALRYGAPPHGGIALGLGRLVMLLAGAESLRDVTAFPKAQSAREPMSGAPSPVNEKQLRELSLKTVGVEEGGKAPSVEDGDHRPTAASSSS